MTTSVQHHFTAEIKARAKQQRGDGYALTFDWKLPGSQFDFVLYGRDWEQIEGWDMGDIPDVSIVRGTLKQGKTGNYESDYFWNLESISKGNGQPTPAASNGNYPSGNPQDEYRRSKEEMRWTEAVHNAVKVSIAMAQANNWDGFSDETFADSVQGQASLIYDIIAAGPPQETAPDGSESPVQAVSEPQPTTRPQRKPPASSPEKMQELNDARFGDDGEEVYTPYEINNYIAANYAERDARDLTADEVDEVIAAVKDGNIK